MFPPPGPPFSVTAQVADQGCQGPVGTERGGPGSGEGARVLEEGGAALCARAARSLGSVTGSGEQCSAEGICA